MKIFKSFAYILYKPAEVPFSVNSVTDSFYIFKGQTTLRDPAPRLGKACKKEKNNEPNEKVKMIAKVTTQFLLEYTTERTLLKNFKNLCFFKKQLQYITENSFI